MAIFAISDTRAPHRGLAVAMRSEIAKRGMRVAYLSSVPQAVGRPWFHSTASEYRRLDSKIELEYFDLSQSFSNGDLARLLAFGTIHLSGGNAFAFLRAIRARGVAQILRTHCENGGLIIGVSAGAIVLTPSVAAASIAGDRDEENLKSNSALGLLPFEFIPHFGNAWFGLDKALVYSRTCKHDVYACADADGVFLRNDIVVCYGRPRCLRRGVCESV